MNVLIINYDIKIMKSLSTLMYTVWHVDKYKITFKLVINWTNEILVTDICYTDVIYPFWSELFDTFKNIILLRIFPL